MERMETTHEMLRFQQKEVRQQDCEEPLLFAPGEYVWLENKRRRKGINPKLQDKFVGPYEVLRSFPNHTYKISRQRQRSTQDEQRLKKYNVATGSAGRAPVEVKPRRGPNMKGAVARRRVDQKGLLYQNLPRKYHFMCQDFHKKDYGMCQDLHRKSH